MMKKFILGTALAIALGTGGAVFAQTIDYTSPTATPSTTLSPTSTQMSPSPTGTTNNGLKVGQGGGTMPNGAPATGLGGASTQ